MKMIKISENVPEASAIGLGCMRITGLGSGKAVRELVETSMEAGINFFDHADIYAGGEAEAARASDICLTRDEWYELYLSAGKKLP